MEAQATFDQQLVAKQSDFDKRIAEVQRNADEGGYQRGFQKLNPASSAPSFLLLSIIATVTTVTTVVVSIIGGAWLLFFFIARCRRSPYLQKTARAAFLRRQKRSFV